MVALCPEDAAAAAALCEHPYGDQPACMGPGNEAVCQSTPGGTITFDGEGTVEVATTSTLITQWNFTDACLEAVATSGDDGPARCASLTSERLACRYEASCTCQGQPIEQQDDNRGTYVINGNEVVLGDDPPATYCVGGDRLVMDYYVAHPVSWRYWVLERAP